MINENNSKTNDASKAAFDQINAMYEEISNQGKPKQTEGAPEAKKGFLNLKDGVRCFGRVKRAEFNARLGIAGEQVSGLLKLGYIGSRLGDIFDGVSNFSDWFTFKGITAGAVSLHMALNPSFAEQRLDKIRQASGFGAFSR